MTETTATRAEAQLAVIHDAASKVNGRRDELALIARRLQFILQGLEDGKKRAIIQPDAAYDTALRNASEVVERASQLTRRMLRLSLGDKTWNDAEIANELQMLDNATKTFLTADAVCPFALKFLDHVRIASEVQPPAIEDIVEKIKALYLVAPTKLGPQHPYMAGLHQKHDGWTQASQRMTSTSVIGQAEGLVFDHLTSLKMVSLTICDLHKNTGQPKVTGVGPERAFMSLPGHLGIKQVKEALRDHGFVVPLALKEDVILNITVTSGVSVYDATAPGGLQISLDEPLLWWMDKYQEYYGFAAPTPMQTTVSWTRNSLQTQDITIRCHRTLRVPEASGASKLPPGLGSFPFFPVEDLGSRAPEQIRRRGGFMMPMFRREALWISFKASNNPAVKVSVGGINAISGESATSITPLNHTVDQDYVVAGLQPWLDGIVTETGVVRQFVVTDLGQGYTVEEQNTGEAKVGGIQFDIYPRRNQPAGSFTTASPHVRTLTNTTATPRELDLEVGDVVEYRAAQAIRQVVQLGIHLHGKP